MAGYCLGGLALMEKWEKWTLLSLGTATVFAFLIPVWRSPYNAEYVSLPQWVYEGIKHKQLPHVEVSKAILRAKSRVLLLKSKLGEN